MTSVTSVTSIDEIITSTCESGNISHFLNEISEVYSDAPYMGLKYEDVLKKVELKLLEWKCNQVDLSYYINKPIYSNGESELMFTMRWNRGIDVILPWFMLLVKFGGNPYQKNKKGHDSFDIAHEIFKKNGMEDEMADLFEEVEHLVRTR